MSRYIDADKLKKHYSWWQGGTLAKTLDEMKRDFDTIVDLQPTIEPKEEFEWCHDCKEYDRQAHCCHRWTKVIRNTVEEIKSNTEPIKHGRLIDADALFESGAILIPTKYYEGARIVIDAIRNAPTIEAEPVKHGRWKVISEYPKKAECSYCGYPIEHELVCWWDYCPHCGADMRGGENDI